LDLCYEGYAVSFGQKVESPIGGGDDTALNGICLRCSNGKVICSTVGPWGNWAWSSRCDKGFNGANFKIERKQGSGGGGNDDTAANNLQLTCSTGGSYYAGNGGRWGDWQGHQYCYHEQRICGIQTKVERNQGGGDDDDDTALNGVKLICCDRTVITG
jgi:hypothetical protein